MCVCVCVCVYKYTYIYTETVLSSWLPADEGRVSHVLSHVAWWNIYIYLYIYMYIHILNQTLLSACEYPHTRSGERRASGFFTFLTRRDWEGSDVYRFSWANSIFKAH